MTGVVVDKIQKVRSKYEAFVGPRHLKWSYAILILLQAGLTFASTVLSSGVKGGEEEPGKQVILRWVHASTVFVIAILAGIPVAFGKDLNRL